MILPAKQINMHDSQQESGCLRENALEPELGGGVSSRTDKHIKA